jgi:CheY-like chemotaxis protein
MLGRACYSLVARDGSTGMEMARSAVPDVIVLDLGLPDVHGLEVLAALKADRVTRDTQVAILSGDTRRTTIERCRELGASDYLAKHVSSPSLLARLLRSWALVPAEVAAPPAAGFGTAIASGGRQG